jgi:iron complex outermembrane receptor protein
MAKPSILLSACALGAIGAALATPAFAQSSTAALAAQESTATPAQTATPADTGPATAADTAATGQEIIVTGTRIASGFAAPTPVTVLTNQRTQALAITNVGDALNQLPAFRPSASATTQANNGGNIGARLLDLRGLEPKRTLVLVDGHRFVPSTSTGSVDVNLIPGALLQRTDIVTGGASAAYGSDAVAGVANFVLNHKLTGISAEVQGGISQRGDNASQYVSIAGGTQIGERVHVILAGEYENNDGMGTCNSRKWCAANTLILGNSPAGTGGLPANLIIGNVNTSTSSPAGVINQSFDASGRAIGTAATDPLRGNTFNPDGSVRRFQYGTFVGPLFMLGGEGSGRNGFIEPLLLKVPVRRYTGYGSIQADLTDHITATLDLSYGRVEGHVVSNVLRDFNGSLMGRIQRNNPFIPAAIQQAMDASGAQSFILGRTGFDLGPAQADSVTQTYRSVAALKGDLGSRWKWDIAYEYGKTKFRQDGYNLLNVLNLPKAVAAVRNSSGQIVCAINADAITTNDDASCAPLNLFGENRFSQAAKNYVTGRGWQTTTNEQNDVTANVQGSLFDLPAGPLSIAVGAEYRRDSISGDADAVSRQNGFFQLNGSAIAAGHINVKEAYGEAEIPVLKESALGYSLNFNGAIRRTDYSTSGAVTTWKAGGVYEPIRAIRLRATKSRDIRAPNLFELRGPTVKSTIGLTDPRNGLQTNPTIFTGSNPNLTPEKADSLTLGVVLAPTGGFARRMRLSVDYYDIKVKNVIGPLGAQSIVNFCQQGVTAQCAFVTRDSGGTITEVRDVNQNSARLRTRGFDIEFQYRQPLGKMGDLNLQMLANITQELTTADGVDRAGQNGVRTGTIPGTPDYTLDGVLTWAKGDFSLVAHGHYIPHGIFWTNFTDPSQAGYSVTGATGVNNNQVSARAYFDLAANLKIPMKGGWKPEFFVAINNVLDQDPPRIPGASGGTNQILYDPVGRSFKFGARVHFGG